MVYSKYENIIWFENQKLRKKIPKPSPADGLCMVDNGGCSQVCNVTVSDAQQGVTCSCHSGYFLAANGKDCIGESQLYLE